MSSLPFGAIARDNAGRRIKILRMSVDLLLIMFKEMDGRNVLKCEGLPKDAKVVGFSHDVYADRRQIALQIESEEFSLVPPDNSCEQFELRFRCHDLPYDPWDETVMDRYDFFKGVIAGTVESMKNKSTVGSPMQVEMKPDGNFVIKTTLPPPEAIVPLVRTCPCCGGSALETIEKGRWQCEKNHTFRTD